MLKSAVLLLAAAAVATALPAVYPKVDPNAQGEHWAVLVAGSNTWGNYRHQADVAHSYQVLVNNGFKRENIITMMYDDIANNPENPNKGVIINQPNGPNVYKGVQIDYREDKVTPENFMKVLKGDASAGAKVLKSGPNDHVFVFFCDHGGPGIIAFPSSMLSSSDLISTLQYMHSNNMYNKLVFYMEACESGSMFANLPNDIEIYATTAADATHSSYACYYDSTLHTYLGDVYSVNWLQDSDKGRLASETLQQQYTIVKQETNTSTVCLFGETSMGSDTLNEYQGGDSTVEESNVFHLHRPAPKPTLDAIDSREVEVAILRHKLAAATTPEARRAAQAALDKELAKREATRHLFTRIAAAVAGEEHALRHMQTRVQLPEYSCVEQAAKAFHDRCLNLGQESWALQHVMSFASMCKEGHSSQAIVDAITAACPLQTRLNLAAFN